MNLRAAWGVLGVSPHMTHLLPYLSNLRLGKKCIPSKLPLPLLEVHEAQN